MLKYQLWRIKQTLKTNTDAALKYRRLNIETEQRSTKIINLVGYVILLLVLLDYGFILISSQLFNPSWAYNTAGQLVENIWGLLFGLVLIFYRRDQDIVKSREAFCLKIISWLTLCAGISYFLITPVIIGNGYRIYRGNHAQMTSQISLQKTQVEQYAQQLGQASEEQLNSLLQRYTAGEDSGTISSNSAEQIKTNLLAEVEKQQLQAKNQLQTQFGQKKTNLVKTTTKWSIGAIVSGMCLVLIWRHTAWARIR
ncbi:MAG: HpsJ family protein [Cyanobacteria bacterium P01_G01_bin.19]